MLIFLLLTGCGEPIEVDDSARGDFIMGGVINTQIIDPYSYASRCPAHHFIEIVLRTASNEQMIITMELLEPSALTQETWQVGEAFEFAYVNDPISPGDWLEAGEGWLTLEAFETPGGRVIGLVDVWGEMFSVEGELLVPDYHIRGSFDIPRTDACQ